MKNSELFCPECGEPVFWDPDAECGYCLNCLARFRKSFDTQAAIKAEVSDLADNRRIHANKAYHNKQYATAHERYIQALKYDKYHPLLLFHKGLSAGYAFDNYQEVILSYQQATAVLKNQGCTTLVQNLTNTFTNLFLYFIADTYDCNVLSLTLKAQSILDPEFRANKYNLLRGVHNRCSELYILADGKFKDDEFLFLLAIIKRAFELLKQMDEEDREREEASKKKSGFWSLFKEKKKKDAF